MDRFNRRCLWIQKPVCTVVFRENRMHRSVRLRSDWQRMREKHRRELEKGISQSPSDDLYKGLQQGLPSRVFAWAVY